MPLPTKALGRGGPQVSAIGFGAMGMSAFYGKPMADSDRFALLDHMVGTGENFVDTADVYADNEDMIGNWLEKSGKRKDIFLCTKFGAGREQADGSYKVDSSPEWAKLACDRSLKRLKVDCIDLYYVHRIDHAVPIEKTVEAMVELKKEGKIRHLGLSECSAATLRRAHAVHPISAIQVEYSAFLLDIEDPSINLLATARELGVAVVAYSPLGRGFLTGQIKSRADFDDDDFRKNNARFSDENFPKNLELVTKLQTIAKKLSCTVGQLCLAWLSAQGDDIIPIPGTKKIAYFDENIGSLDIKLSPELLKEIRSAIEAVEVQGHRYEPAYRGNLYVDTVEL